MQCQTILAFILLLIIPNGIPQEQPNFNKRNLVIFFTKPDVDLANDVDDSGISFLKFPANGKVEATDSIPKQYQHLFSIDPQDKDCDNIFNRYLMDLIDWATNSKHMVTATVTSTDTDICSVVARQYNDAENYHRYEMYKFSINEPINIDTDSFGYIPAEPADPYRSSREQEYFDQLPLEGPAKEVKKLPPLTFATLLDNIAIINADNPMETNKDRDREGAFYENDDNAYRRSMPPKKRNREFKTLLRYSPHRQEIRQFKLDSDLDEYKDAMEYPANKPDNDNYWKILNNEDSNKNIKIPTKNEQISDAQLSSVEKERLKQQTSDLIDAFGFRFFSTIRDAFANSFLNPTNKRNAKNLENNIDLSVLGKVQQHTMFDLVKSTFKNLKTYVANHQATSRGFLLVVIGGNISETSNPFSDLVQSTKYILENTDRSETLVLVTCYCPLRGEGNQRKRNVPFYAQGLNSLELQSSANMWDIFDKMKKMIGSKIETLTKSKDPGEIKNEPITDNDAPNKTATGHNIFKRTVFEADANLKTDVQNAADATKDAADKTKTGVVDAANTIGDAFRKRFSKSSKLANYYIITLFMVILVIIFRC